MVQTVGTECSVGRGRGGGSARDRDAGRARARAGSGADQAGRVRHGRVRHQGEHPAPAGAAAPTRRASASRPGLSRVTGVLVDEWEPAGVYLNTASYGLPPRAAFEAMEAALADWRGGRTGWRDWHDQTDVARACWARIAGCPLDDVAVGANVSGLVGLVAASLPAGSRVVAAEGEYTSLVWP